MKHETVTIAKRTFALAFTMDAMVTMQDYINDFDLKNLSDYARSARTLPDMLYALAQQGELLEGRPLDVDRAWFGSHISPSPRSAIKLQTAVLNALAEGFRMDTETGEDAEVDVVLEEIKKNDQPA